MSGVLMEGPRTPGRSILIRRLFAGLLLLLIVVSTGCGGGTPGAPSADGPLKLLDGGGLAPPPTHEGETLAFAFPLMRNTGAEGIEVLGFKLLHVPAGVQVLKYRMLSVRDVHGYLLGSFPPSQAGRYGYDRYPDYMVKNPLIPAHKLSQYFGVVYTRLLHDTGESASGCEVDYLYRGKRYDAVGDCSFDFQPPPGAEDANGKVEDSHR